MSARQQFFPLASRPSSRAAHLNSDKENTPKQFKPDLSNPLHQQSSSASGTSPNPQAKHHNPEPKQLNLSSLKKPRPSLAGTDNHQNQNNAKDGQNNSERSNGIKIRGSVNSLATVASPTPRILHNVGQILSGSPNRPFSPALQAGKTSLFDACPPGPTEGSFPPSSTHIATQVPSAATIVLPGSNFGTQASSLGHNIDQGNDLDSHEHSLTTAFGTTIPINEYRGAQRVLLDGVLEEHAMAPSRRSSMRSSKGSTKRTRADFESHLDEDDLGHNRVKHPRELAMNIRPERAYMCDSQGFPSPGNPQAGFRGANSTPPLVASHQVPPRENALDKIFGLDVDEYVVAHTAKYEEAREKWKSCSMEEWVSGADELAHRFTQMLDFVKDHMTAKIKLFATMNKSIDDHNVVLDERNKSLVLAKEQLIKSSGLVLGQ